MRVTRIRGLSCVLSCSLLLVAALIPGGGCGGSGGGSDGKPTVKEADPMTPEQKAEWEKNYPQKPAKKARR